MKEPKGRLWGAIWPEVEAIIHRVISNESQEISLDVSAPEKWCEHILQLYADYVKICNNLTLLVNAKRHEHMRQTLLQILDLVARRWFSWQNELQIVQITWPECIDSALMALKMTPNDLTLDLPGATRAARTPARDALKRICGESSTRGKQVENTVEWAKGTPKMKAMWEKLEIVNVALQEVAEGITLKGRELLKYKKSLESPCQWKTSPSHPELPVLTYRVPRKFSAKKKLKRKSKSVIYDQLKVLLQCALIGESESPRRHVEEVSEPPCEVEAPPELLQLHRRGMLSFGLGARLADFITERYSADVLLRNKLRFLQFTLCNHVDTPRLPKLCIVGEPGVGKKWLVECFAAQIDAVVINIGGAFEVRGSQDVSDFVEDVMVVAKFLQPTILLLDRAHMFFATRATREMKNLVSLLTKRLSREIDGDKILFIGVSNEPWRGRIKRMRSTFTDFLWLPPPRYPATFWALANHQDLPWASLLAWATRDLSIATVIESVEQSFPAKRSLRTSPSQFVLHLTHAVKNLITCDNVQYLASVTVQKKMKVWVSRAIVKRRKTSRRSKKVRK